MRDKIAIIAVLTALFGCTSGQSQETQELQVHTYLELEIILEGWSRLQEVELKYTQVPNGPGCFNVQQNDHPDGILIAFVGKRLHSSECKNPGTYSFVVNADTSEWTCFKSVKYKSQPC